MFSRSQDKRLISTFTGWANVFRDQASANGDSAFTARTRQQGRIASPRTYGTPMAEGAGAYFQDQLVAGTWIHIVAVYEPGDTNTQPPAGVHIYKNGVHRLGPPSPGTLYRTYGIVPVAGTLPLRLGTRDAASSGSASVSYLTGGLDEIAIYPRVLRPDEILENYTTAVSPA